MRAADLIEASKIVADVPKALVWPAFAGAVVVVYRRPIKDLLGRIRKASPRDGVEFADATPQAPARSRLEPILDLERPASAAAAVSGLPAVAEAPAAVVPALPAPQVAAEELPPELLRLRTPPVLIAEQALVDLPLIKQLAPPLRERALSTIAAMLAVMNSYERAEGGIWASRVRLLEFLNSAVVPVPTAAVQERFYDVAVGAFPNWYQSYPFERWLEFLKSYFFIELVPAGWQLSATGRDYLQWVRAEACAEDERLASLDCLPLGEGGRLGKNAQ